MGTQQTQSLVPQGFDLTTLQNVKDWLNLGSNPTADDNLIQACISAVSIYVNNRCGYGPANGVFPMITSLSQPLVPSSPLNGIMTCDEFYDGKGTDTLLLKNRPIVTVTTVNIDGVSIPQSTNQGSPGWVVDSEAISIRLRWAQNGISTNRWAYTGVGMWGLRSMSKGLIFTRGVQNVEIVYTAGFPVTPIDLDEAVKEIVAQNYKRRDWIDEGSRSMGAQGGSTRFRDWIIPPWADHIIKDYRRTK